MPRSTSASRIQVSSAATVSDLPDSSTASTYTWSFTVPTRGIVHRAALVLVDGSSFGANALMEDACYIHTTCAAGAGKDNTVAGEATSIVAQFPFSLHNADHMGGTNLFASSTYVVSVVLAQNQSSRTVTQGSIDAFSDGSPIVYDASGTTLGPTQSGTLFLTLSGDGSVFNYTAMTSVTAILDIEPLP
ncbi:MAG: hypothetical protein GOVbin1923_5 [Prokaryotic dsDNA virus sp.]|nr:MAG: hypothetical protein GOVbin1923_5 [Prokaryotic dsDNA virus sp.]|tara:strand:- start:37934 stop:38500 length:567 start_codon:yes stop_codon:yes gene_type:complete